MKYFFFLITSVFLTTYCLAQEKENWKTRSAETENLISGNAQLLSHFIVKGLSYSDNNPAMNASFLVNLGPQVKFGLWGSNISNLSARDDNFWLKIYAQVKFNSADNILTDVYIEDSRFYKSDQRNGQNIGFNFKYKSYDFGFEWMSNLEGTQTNAEYLWFGRLFDYKKNMKWGGYSGLTNSHSSSFNSYLDFKILGQYIFNPVFNAEAGVTFNSNSVQFGTRGDPFLYAAIKLSY